MNGVSRPRNLYDFRQWEIHFGGWRQGNNDAPDADAPDAVDQVHQARGEALRFTRRGWRHSGARPEIGDLLDFTRPRAPTPSSVGESARPGKLLS